MSKEITTIIVDDEALARQLLHEYLAKHADITVVAECTNGFEAVKAVHDLKPNLLFLDIQMPRLNGFEVLELLDHHPAVVFVTAYDEFALKAFEVHAIDYLLKPLSQERFEEALNRARKRIGVQESFNDLITGTRERPLHRVIIKDGQQIRIIPTKAIDYVEAQDDYVCVVAEGKRLLKQTTLTALEEELDPMQFIRVHRSFLLNLERLSRIELYAKDSRVAILKDGSRIPISRSGYTKLKQHL